MSDELTTLAISLLGSGLILTIAMLIRVRGPIGLIKGDWTRVSDAQGLGQYVSMIMTIMGALIAAHGALIYGFHGDKAARNTGSVIFVALMAVCALAMLIGQQRYHDKPQHDGRR